MDIPQWIQINKHFNTSFSFIFFLLSTALIRGKRKENGVRRKSNLTNKINSKKSITHTSELHLCRCEKTLFFELYVSHPYFACVSGGPNMSHWYDSRSSKVKYVDKKIKKKFTWRTWIINRRVNKFESNASEVSHRRKVRLSLYYYY